MGDETMGEGVKAWAQAFPPERVRAVMALLTAQVNAEDMPHMKREYQQVLREVVDAGPQSTAEVITLLTSLVGACLTAVDDGLRTVATLTGRGATYPGFTEAVWHPWVAEVGRILYEQEFTGEQG